MSAQPAIQDHSPNNGAANNVTPFPSPSGSRVVTLDLDNAAQLHSYLMQFRDECLTNGVDYGIIPHTSKNTLYKPGAEKLMHFFGLALTLEITARLEDWKVGQIAYEVKAILRSKRSGEIEAEGIGNCNSKERKYKSQDAANVANTILKMAKKPRPHRRYPHRDALIGSLRGRRRAR